MKTRAQESKCFQHKENIWGPDERFNLTLIPQSSSSVPNTYIRNSQPPLSLASRDLTPASGFHQYLHSHAYTHTQSHTYTYQFNNFWKENIHIFSFLIFSNSLLYFLSQSVGSRNWMQTLLPFNQKAVHFIPLGPGDFCIWKDIAPYWAMLSEAHIHVLRLQARVTSLAVIWEGKFWGKSGRVLTFERSHSTLTEAAWIQSLSGWIKNNQ